MILYKKEHVINGEKKERRDYMGINQFRKKIILKGYANITDAQNFLKCDFYKAKKIFEEIEEEIKKEGKKSHPRGVSTKRLLPYIDLTEKKIFEYAEIEKNESADTDSRV